MSLANQASCLPQCDHESVNHRISVGSQVGDVNLRASNGGEERESSSGLLEVFTAEFGWSAVNFLGLGGVEAQVVCVQLGYTFVANVSTYCTNSRYYS